MHERRIPIPDPCHVAWGDMPTLGSAGRYCQNCKHAVVDLSALTQAQAERVVRAAKPDLCVSYLRDASGQIVFSKPAALQLSAGSIAVGAMLSLAACSRSAADPALQAADPALQAGATAPQADVPAPQEATPQAEASPPLAQPITPPQQGSPASKWPSAQSSAEPTSPDGVECDLPPKVEPKHPAIKPPQPPPVRLAGKLVPNRRN